MNIRSEFIEESVISALYYAEQKAEYPDENARIEANSASLRESFTSREQRVLLLDIVDDERLIRAKETQRYYALGFRRAMMLMIESLYFEE